MSHPPPSSGCTRLLATTTMQRQEPEVEKRRAAGERVRGLPMGRISWTAPWTKPSERPRTWGPPLDTCLTPWGLDCTSSSSCSLHWWHSWVKDTCQIHLRGNFVSNLIQAFLFKQIKQILEKSAGTDRSTVGQFYIDHIDSITNE